MLVRAVELELDDQHFVFTDLRVQHLSADRSHANQGAWRVGGAWTGMPPTGQDTLQRWMPRPAIAGAATGALWLRPAHPARPAGTARG